MWVWHDHDETLETVGIQQANVAKLLETYTTHVIDNTSLVLDRVIDEVREHDIMGAGADRRWPKLVEIAKTLPVSGGRLWLYRADGSAVMASHLRHSTNNANDREYFNAQRQPGVGLFIGETVVGKTTGKKVFNVSRRLDGPDGAFAGVAMAAIDIDVFIRVVSDLQLGKSAAYTLVRDDGAVIMRYPDAGAAGKRFQLTKLNEMLAQQPAGQYTSVSAIDGIVRQIAYRKHPQYPLTVVVSVSSLEILAPWRQRALVAGSGVVVLLAVAAWLTVMARRAERRERLAVARMQTVLDTVADGICGIDARGRVVFINPAGARLLGFQPADLLGKSLHETCHYALADGRPHASEDCPICKLQKEGGEKQGTDYFWRNGDGIFPVEYAATKVDEREGELGAVVSFRDISARLAAERELVVLNETLEKRGAEAEAANVAKSRFLATMSHEIRTPMNGILGMAQLLLLPGIDETERRDYARIVFNSGQTLLTLLNDILDFSKIEAGKVELESLPLDPAQLIAEIATLFAEQAAAKGLRLEAAWVGAAGERYQGDPVRVRQMLTNLVSNAIKFTAQGFVRIEGREVGAPDEPAALLEFAVADSGIGIPAAKQAQLFKPFTQADASTTREFGGTGLGLSIVRNLAVLMGGDTGLESAAGQGARVWFRIRAERVAAGDERRHDGRPVAAEADVAPLPVAHYVLVVEDNTTNRIVIESMLKRLGIRFESVGNGHEACERVAAGVLPDLVLMDCQMPVMDGFEATRRIRAWERQGDRPHLPVIALTAGAFAEDREQCRASGMDDFLTKPLNIEDLRAVLNKWLQA
jgi:PAS domain S-box-containing protein